MPEIRFNCNRLIGFVTVTNFIVFNYKLKILNLKILEQLKFFYFFNYFIPGSFKLNGVKYL